MTNTTTKTATEIAAIIANIRKLESRLPKMDSIGATLALCNLHLAESEVICGNAAGSIPYIEKARKTLAVIGLDAFIPA